MDYRQMDNKGRQVSVEQRNFNHLSDSGSKWKADVVGI